MLARLAAAGIWVVEAPGHTLPPYAGTMCYFIGSSAGVWLVDTGDGGEAARRALLAAWRTAGSPPVTRVVVTHAHRDHYGGAAWAGRHFQAPVGIHAADLTKVKPTVPEVTPLEPGTYRVGGQIVEVLHAPGHTPGQVNLWLPAERFLLAGDNVLGETTSVVAPPDGNLRQYQRTLSRLAALNPARIGPGHGRVVDSPAQWLLYYQEHRASRERQLLELLASRPATISDLALAIYGPTESGTLAAGQLMLSGHLAALVDEGTVTLDPDQRYHRSPHAVGG